MTPRDERERGRGKFFPPKGLGSEGLRWTETVDGDVGGEGTRSEAVLQGLLLGFNTKSQNSLETEPAGTRRGSRGNDGTLEGET